MGIGITIQTKQHRNPLPALLTSPPSPKKAAMGSKERWLCMRYASISSSAATRHMPQTHQAAAASCNEIHTNQPVTSFASESKLLNFLLRSS